jgi:hypothetical protein
LELAKRELELAKRAVNLATTNPAEAEELTRSITDTDLRGAWLKTVTDKMASHDPVRAERIAKSIPDADGKNMYYASIALMTVAWTVAPNSPHDARRIFDDAEKLAHRVRNPRGREGALKLIDQWKTDRGL